jgi:hypothetical protein
VGEHAADVHDRDARSVAPGEPGHALDDAVDESDSSVGGIASGVIGQLGIRLCASEGGAADEGEVWQPGHGSHTTAPEAILGQAELRVVQPGSLMSR